MASARPAGARLKPLGRFEQLRSLSWAKGVSGVAVISEMAALESLTLRSITLDGLDVLVPLERLTTLALKLGGTSDLPHGRIPGTDPRFLTGSEIGPGMLPAGWDLARIRERVPGAGLVDPSMHRVFSITDGSERVRLAASTIIDFGALSTASL